MRIIVESVETTVDQPGIQILADPGWIYRFLTFEDQSNGVLNFDFDKIALNNIEVTSETLHNIATIGIREYILQTYSDATFHSNVKAIRISDLNIQTQVVVSVAHSTSRLFTLDDSYIFTFNAKFLPRKIHTFESEHSAEVFFDSDKVSASHIDMIVEEKVKRTINAETNKKIASASLSRKSMGSKVLGSISKG